MGVAESVAVAAAAHLITAPVVAAISGGVSVVAVAANVLAEPVVAAATVLGFGAAVIALGWLAGGAALAWLAGWPCRWLVAVAEFFGGLHGASIPWPGGFTGAAALVVLLAGLGLAAGLGARRVLVAVAATALLIFIPVRSVTSGWPPPGWVFAACDVGQGDALLLNAGPGRSSRSMPDRTRSRSTGACATSTSPGSGRSSSPTSTSTMSAACPVRCAVGRSIGS